MRPLSAGAARRGESVVRRASDLGFGEDSVGREEIWGRKGARGREIEREGKGSKGQFSQYEKIVCLCVTDHDGIDGSGRKGNEV